MIRTVWLALLFLGGIAAIASFKFASSAIGNSVGSQGGHSEQSDIVLKANGEQLAKADKLPVNVLVSYELENITPVGVEPLKANPDTTGSVSAPDRQPVEVKASPRSSKSIVRKARKSGNSKAQRSRPTNNKVECPPPQTIIAYFNPSAHCASTTTAKRAISTK